MLLFLQRKHILKNKIAVIGKMFEKQIIIYGEIQSDAVKLQKLLKKQDKHVQKSFKKNKNVNENINISSIIQKLQKIYNCNKNKFINLDSKEFDFQESRLVKSIKRIAYKCILDSDSVTKRAFKQLKFYAKKNIYHQDWYHKIIYCSKKGHLQIKKQKKARLRKQVKNYILFFYCEVDSNQIQVEFHKLCLKMNKKTFKIMFVFKNLLQVFYINIQKVNTFQLLRWLAKGREQNLKISSIKKIQILIKQALASNAIMRTLTHFLRFLWILNLQMKLRKFQDLIRELTQQYQRRMEHYKVNQVSTIAAMGESINLPQNKLQGIVAYSKNKE
ncbi:hypothetical protein ABPG72_000235 [Tetrahymena utriculariae]